MKLKKKVIILLAVCACACSAAALAGCEHEHTYGGGWTFDATHHWHEATCEHSGEKGDYAEHTWDSGTVTTAATCTEAGLTTYACTVCAATRTEPISATGHTFAEEWSSDNTHHWHEASCEHTGEKDGYAEHSWNAGEVTTPVTCETAGVATYTCTVCDAEKEEPIPATGHSYAEAWTSDETQHWHAAACGHDVKKDAADHSYQQGVCTVCEHELASKGLVYELSGDETYYTVKGMGTCTDTDLYIPSTYSGLPVKAIGDYAFNLANIKSVTIHKGIATIGKEAFHYRTDLTKVTLHEGLTAIGEKAFSYCGVLQLTIPASVTTIGKNAFDSSELTSVTFGQGSRLTSIEEETFAYCQDLATVRLPEGLLSIGTSAFSGCGITSIDIPDTVTSIGESAFGGCNGLTSVTIPKGVTTITSNVFSSCNNLASVIIHEGVTTIESYAFNACMSLVNVYYEGTQSGWSNVSVHSEAFPRSPASLTPVYLYTVYYYSATDPGTGNYWQYGTDGVTPVKW